MKLQHEKMCEMERLVGDFGGQRAKQVETDEVSKKIFLSADYTIPGPRSTALRIYLKTDPHTRAISRLSHSPALKGMND